MRKPKNAPTSFAAGMVALVFAVLATPSGLAAEEKRPPNFVLIMADDLGYGDIGCFGSESTQTPHLDRLAAEGLRLTDFHSNGAVCSPTRAALLTGRYQQRSGIGGVVTAKGHRDTGLGLEEITFAEALKDAGYATAIFGKWHLGYDPKFNPVRQGFDTFRGFVSGNVDYQSHIDQEGFEDWWRDTTLSPEPGYTTDLITEYGVRFIEAHKDQPFCLYLPHEAPHYPYQGPDDPADRKVGQPNPIQGSREDIPAAYREMVESMDAGIGRIIEAVEKHGLEEDTLILFFSDNGANSQGDNGGLRGFKGGPWEGGHRVPFIAWWPGTIQAGGESDVTALTMDLFPTLLEAAGVELPEEPSLDGRSLLPVLRGDKPPEELTQRILFWKVGRGDVVRQGPWKLIREKPRRRKKAAGDESDPNETPEPVPWQLYHLGDDLAEEVDLAKDNAAKVRKLAEAYEAWAASWAEVEKRS